MLRARFPSSATTLTAFYASPGARARRNGPHGTPAIRKSVPPRGRQNHSLLTKRCVLLQHDPRGTIDVMNRVMKLRMIGMEPRMIGADLFHRIDAPPKSCCDAMNHFVEVE